jgi:hypothetical protein
VVVVVELVDVVVWLGQLGPVPGPGHASQQLLHWPAMPPFASHAAALFAVLHLVTPFFVRQHVTKPGFPHVDFDAHDFARPRQLRLTSTASICCAAQRT